MTEEQARQKWCPMFRLAGDDDSTAYNVTGGNGDYVFAHCIGSRCMMWRFLPGNDKLADQGYCGLAGKP